MKDLETRISSAFARLIVRRPGRALIVLLLVVAAAVGAATKLRINANQLELLDPNLREVKDVKRVVDMVGGAGHLLIALRGSDEKTLKATADDLAAMLEKDKEDVRSVDYKINTEFARKNAALFMKTGDLEELHDRVMRYLRDRIKRANPFFFEIRKTQPVELKVDDIVDKYTRIGKRTITDDYWISDDKKMLLLVVKPMWDSTELDRTGALIKKLRAEFASYSKSNAQGVSLVENYVKTPSSDPKTVEFGFTGSYKLGYDEQYEIQRSLIPVSGIALIGVVAVMFLFFRRRFGAIALVLAGLLLGIGLAFGFAEVAVGELNMVTSMLGGILLGLGIDFGIHAVYRLREELGRGEALATAVRAAVTHQGPASFISAAGIGVAFFSLLLSGFRGFSQFGLLAGAGVFLIGVAIYVWIPSALLVADRAKKGLGEKILGKVAPQPVGPAANGDRIPKPWLLLSLSLLLALGVSYFAPKVKFDYNTRALSVENQPSMKLNDEIGERFDLSSDPAAIYTPDLASAKRLYEKLTSTKYDTVDQVVSLYSFVPPMAQQERNAKILADWKKELSEIDPNVLPPEYQKRWDEAMGYLDAKPYTVKDLPPYLLETFRNIPSAKPENRGWLTFIYPRVNVYDGRQILRFAKEMEDVRVGPNEVYHTAGLTILYATLARIVLHDSKVAVGLTAVLLLIILLIDLRSLTSALVALIPLVFGVGMMLGAMALLGSSLNFMNIVVFPIVLGYGVSHGVYLMHRFNEGTSPRAALRSVGQAVMASTLTTLAGWAALLAAPHRGLRTMGTLACLGMAATLLVSFTVMPAVMQILHDRRMRKQDGGAGHAPESESEAA